MLEQPSRRGRAVMDCPSRGSFSKRPVARCTVAFVLASLLNGCSPAAETVDNASVGSVTIESGVPATALEMIQVVEIVDGDTLDVRIDGVIERVRLIGINTPERGECFAAEAAAALERLTVGRQLRLQSDTSDRDQYGRLLRYVWADDQLVNEQLVLEGFDISQPFELDTAFADQFDATQESAMEERTGLWGAEACGEAAPDVTLRIVEIEYDAPGDDGKNLNGEWVVIANDGARSIDLAGWSLKDESSSHRFVFPSGVMLGAGSSVRIYSGCGSPTETELYWCESGSAIWNNSGDTAFLLDPVGNTVATLAY